MVSRQKLPDLIAALSVVALGVAVVVIGRSYPVGTLSRMGSGYFPVILGGLLALVGVALIWEAIRAGESALQRIPLRPVLMIGLGVLSFGALVERAGLVPATVALVLLSSLAEPPLRPVSTLVIAAVMSALGVALFIHALALPLNAFGG